MHNQQDVTMDFNIERENNIVKNIAKEIVFECAQKGLEVTQELANYVVKLRLLNPKHGFTASEVMPRNLTQQLVHLVVEDLKQDSPAMNCIRMQVYWSSAKLKLAELKKEYVAMMTERAEPYMNELLTLEMDDSNKMGKLIASYVLVYQNLGNPNNQLQLKETIAAIRSLFKTRESNNFFSYTDELKAEVIKNLMKKVTGVRLYLKFCGKAGEAIEDVKKLPILIEECTQEITNVNKKVLSRINDIRDTISCVISTDYFLSHAFQVADIYLPPECDMNDLTHAKKILAIMLQHGIYIGDILSVLEEIDGDVHYLLNQYHETLQKLHAVIKDRETVPTTEVYDHFYKLGELWGEIQSYYYCLECVRDIISDFDDINKAEYFAPTLLEKVTVNPFKAIEAQSKASIETDKSLLLSSVLILREEEDYTLEFNGFCAWTLYYTNGLLVPGNPQAGVHQHHDQYFSFASKNGRELWAKEPDYYLKQIYEYVRENPELVELLHLYDVLYSLRGVQLKKTVERKISTRVENTQTVLHPIEKYWDKDYTFSVWELKKRALTLSRLVKCVTKSAQTVSPHSHFRASIGVLAAPDKDKQVQTMRDNSCVHSTISNYLYGLRGHREDKFRVVELTRPVDEVFERQIILEERSSCKQRQVQKTFRPLQPKYTEPCRSSSSDNYNDSDCNYYYEYNEMD